MKKLLINFCLYLLIKSVIQLDINSPGFSWTELIKNYTLKGERKGITSLNDLDKYEFLIRHVEQSRNNIANADNLRFLTNLISLDIERNQIKSIDNFICELKKLKTIRISNNPLLRIDILTCLTDQLEILELSSIYATRFDSIGKLINLNKLHLDSNKISNIDFVHNLSKLYHLSLESNQINDIKVISRLINLNSLYMSNNNIEMIHHLAKLNRFREINMAYNKIKDISSISSNMVNLTILDLRNNQIKNPCLRHGEIKV